MVGHVRWPVIISVPVRSIVREVYSIARAISLKLMLCKHQKHLQPGEIGDIVEANC